MVFEDKHAMSYDLYFTKPDISLEQFHEYFEGRPHCTAAGSQVCYENKDTGVYFLIAHGESGGEDPEEIPSTATLNLNYYRPHVFGLEAADEISAFVGHFGLSIHDPQTQGMDNGDFDKERFLHAWNHGNELGCLAVLSGENAPRDVFTLPGDRLENIWRWNLNKTSIQQGLGDGRFVPRIFLIEVEGRAASAAVWPDAIPELIPKVDYLAIVRNELAPRSFFGTRRKDTIFVPIRDLDPALEAYATADYALPAYMLPTVIIPTSLRDHVQKLKHTGIKGKGISLDQVLDEEIVNKHRKA